MKKRFKSNIFKSCFLSAAIVLLVFMISFIVVLAMDKSVLFVEALPILVCISVVSAAISFIFWNQSIEVDADEVVFLRCGRPYLRFKTAERVFLMKRRGYRTSPTLRVISIHTADVNEYRFDNFRHKTLKNCCEYIHEIQDLKGTLEDGAAIDLNKFWSQL